MESRETSKLRKGHVRPVLPPHQSYRNLHPRQLVDALSKFPGPQLGTVNIIDRRNLIPLLDTGMLKYAPFPDFSDTEKRPIPNYQAEIMISHIGTRPHDGDIDDGIVATSIFRDYVQDSLFL